MYSDLEHYHVKVHKASNHYYHTVGSFMIKTLKNTSEDAKNTNYPADNKSYITTTRKHIC